MFFFDDSKRRSKQAGIVEKPRSLPYHIFKDRISTSIFEYDKVGGLIEKRLPSSCQCGNTTYRGIDTRTTM
jgi:hypothetical protein